MDELDDLIARADASAHADAVTGVPSRDRALADLERAVELAERHRRPLSAIRLELEEPDDELLQDVARRLAAELRLSDLPSRWSPGGFAVLLPETTLEGARVAARRLKATGERAGAQIRAASIERERGERADTFSARLDAAVPPAPRHDGTDPAPGPDGDAAAAA
jgi:PleD family two-component response regulator